MGNKLLMHITGFVFKCHCGKVTVVPLIKLDITGKEDGDVYIESEYKCQCGIYFSDYIAKEY